MKRGYTLSSCCCVYLISLLFPALPFQICYAFRSPLLSPVMFYCFCFPSYVYITFISPLLAIYLQKRQIQLPPPSTKFMEHWCLPHDGAFFCFSDFSVPAPFSHFSPGRFPLHIFHLCFHLPPDCLTCCGSSYGSYFSIYLSITLDFAIFSGSSYPVLPSSFQMSTMAKLLLRPSNPNQHLFEELPLKPLKMTAAI